MYAYVYVCIYIKNTITKLIFENFGKGFNTLRPQKCFSHISPHKFLAQYFLTHENMSMYLRKYIRANFLHMNTHIHMHWNKLFTTMTCLMTQHFFLRDQVVKSNASRDQRLHDGITHTVCINVQNQSKHPSVEYNLTDRQTPLKLPRSVERKLLSFLILSIACFPSSENGVPFVQEILSHTYVFM
jgi:hypothetical protein